MNTNINTISTSDLTASRESCLTGVYADLKAKRGLYNAYLSNLAEAGIIENKAAGFAALFTGIQSFGDLLALSRELVSANAL